MANYRSITQHIDKGRGIASRKLGSPWNIYRVQNNAAVNVIDPLNLITPARTTFIRKLTSNKDIESEMKLGTFWYEIVDDVTNYQAGDIWVSVDPFYGQGETTVPFASLEFRAFAQTYHASIHKSLGARISTQAQIYRANTADNAGYRDPTLNNALPVVLSSGVFEFGTAGDLASAALIPVGVLAHGRPGYGSALFNGVPDQPKHMLYYVYCPALLFSPAIRTNWPGFKFLEQDRIVLQDGTRLTVLSAFQQEVGAVGAQLICERELGPGVT